MLWEGPRPEGFEIVEYAPRGFTNHSRARAFAADLSAALPGRRLDCVVGFNRLPELDVYYAADPCFVARSKGAERLWFRWSPRHRTWADLEAEVFGAEGAARILALTADQEHDYQRCYGTDSKRFRRVPLPLAPDRGRPANADGERAAFRSEFGLGADSCLLLALGSGFATKGLDRTLRALATLRRQHPGLDARLFVVGEGSLRRYRRLARWLGVQDRVQFFGGRADVQRFLLGADVLVHPARRESGGIVLLEALAAGLPVVATANCGFAGAVVDADAGRVLPEPFDQRGLERALEAVVMDKPGRAAWSVAASAYGARLLERDATGPVVDEILAVAATRPARRRTPPWRSGTWVRQDLRPWFEPDPFRTASTQEGEVFRAVANRRTLRFAARGNDFFLKWHGPVGWGEIWKNLLVGRLPVVSARNEYMACRHLAERGIAAPILAAAGSRGLNPARRESFVVLEALTGRTDLERVAANAAMLSADQLRALVEGVARFARCLHEAGVAHRDFYLCHLLLDDERWARGVVDLAVLDLHRARVFRTLPARWRERDLAALLFSATGLELTPRLLFRFVHVYTGGSLDAIRESGTFWSRVVQRAERLRRRETRRGNAPERA